MYSGLVKNVQEAFEACELARIDCTGLNKSDYKKIGAKLRVSAVVSPHSLQFLDMFCEIPELDFQDLVPCVLISYEYEHILMWRGKDWKSSLPPLEGDDNEAVECISNDSTTSPSATKLLLNHQSSIDLSEGKSVEEKHDLEIHTDSITQSENVSTQNNVAFNLETSSDSQDGTGSDSQDGALPGSTKTNESASDSMVIIHQDIPDLDGEKSLVVEPHLKVHCQDISQIQGSVFNKSDNSSFTVRNAGESSSLEVHSSLDVPCQGILPSLVAGEGRQQADSNGLYPLNTTNEAGIGADDISFSCSLAVEGVVNENLKHQDTVKTEGKFLDRVMLLLKQALENGSAIILDDDSLDADLAFERSVALAKTAPPGPTFRCRNRKTVVNKTKHQDPLTQNDDNLEPEVGISISEKDDSRKNSRRQRRDGLEGDFSDVVQYGSLKIDELAKLLA